MRCYLYRDTHICAVEIINTESDAVAVARAKALFVERKPKFEPPLDGFEVWDLDRMVHRFSLWDEPKRA